MLVLASKSQRRRELLEQIGVDIGKIVDPNVQETYLKSELPIKYVERMALAKSRAVDGCVDDHVLTADTIVTRGRRILGKPRDKTEAEKYLNLLSGCRHRVITSVCLSYQGKTRIRTVVTVVKMKHLSRAEISYYLDSNEWDGKAGGYAIQGIAARFIPFISGSYTNVVGLPLMETVNLLNANGFNNISSVSKNE